MGNKPSSMLQDEEITIICEETGFSPSQIERLYSRFTTLDKGGNGSLSRQDFLAIPELAINPLCDRIVHMFFIDCDDDHDRINFRQFMDVLATFRPQSRNTSRADSPSETGGAQNGQTTSNHNSAPLLFDTIDPSPFTSAGLSKHSLRHASYHDGFHNIHQHHTTNQHSFHYAASSTHLSTHHHHHLSNGHHHHLHNRHHHHHHHNHHHHHSNSSHQEPLVDPEEPPNSRNNKLLFIFKIYDVDDDDLLDLQDLICIIKMMVGTYLEPAIIQKIAERCLREADKNSDGFIDFKEFCQSFGYRSTFSLVANFMAPQTSETKRCLH